MKQSKCGVKFSSILFWLFMAVGIIFCVLSYQARLTGEPMMVGGYGFAKIVSGSMEPTIMTDGYVVFEAIDSADDLVVGDIVIFKNECFGRGENVLYCHRVVEMDGNSVLTRGDNNSANDPCMTDVDDIKGKVVTIWNGIGSVRPGKIVAGVTTVFLVMFVWFDIRDMWKNRRETTIENR